MDPEREARSILDRLNTAVLTCDEQLRVATMNPAAETMFGISAGQAHKRPLSNLLPEEPEMLLQPVAKAQTTRQPVSAYDVALFIYPGIDPGRRIKVDISATPLTATHDEGVLIELYRVDALLNLARDRNREDQYDASRDVVRGLAHEIKNPLGGLRGAAQLLERELTDCGSKQYTRIIIHEADRLRNLVDRMTGSYKPIKHSTVNVHEILQHVRKLILVEVQGSMTIRQDYDPSLPELRGDRDQLIQAILNITRNAVDAMGNIGEITFRTRIERAAYTGLQGRRCVIKVDIEDNGPGIPEHMLERIFFPMVSGRAEGSGLGLSIAQDIVNKHQGSIQLQSEPGHTCFSLLLPFNFQDIKENGS